METHQALPSLMFMTLGIAVVVIAVILVWFLRRPSNRHSMDNQPEKNVAREIDEGKRGG